MTPFADRPHLQTEDIILEISGKNTSRYVHGRGIDEPLAMEQKRSTYFFHADGLGSIVNLTDQRGRVVQSYEYSSFGRMKEHGGEVKQPYGYTGREWDKETGLYYYRARYYDPKGGRFISKDPIGFAGGDVNLYRYVQNNPVLRSDPMGKSPFIDKAFSYAFGFLTKKVTEEIGGQLADIVGNATGFFNPELGVSPEQKEMDTDTDHDGISDYNDSDDDNDGIPDSIDFEPKRQGCN